MTRPRDDAGKPGKDPGTTGKPGKDKAEKTMKAYRDHPGKALDGTLSTSVNGKVVTFAHIDTLDINGYTALDIWLEGPVEGGDPHFRVFNPPNRYVAAGGVLVDDPIMALAAVVAGNGGARKQR
jgi:hypothetical protein